MAWLRKEQDTRRTFVQTLCEIAEKDERVCLIVPDVGFNYEEFQRRFPERYFNLGVTEQSVMAIAAGLALSGMRPFVFTMINFLLFRPAEVVRNAIVCHNAPVVLVGSSGSKHFSFLGFSHNLLHDKEDINFCKNIGLEYQLPKTNEEVKEVVTRGYRGEKPLYIRL